MAKTWPNYNIHKFRKDWRHPDILVHNHVKFNETWPVSFWDLAWYGHRSIKKCMFSNTKTAKNWPNLIFSKFWKDRALIPRSHAHVRYEGIYSINFLDMRWYGRTDGQTDETESNIPTWWPGQGGRLLDTISSFDTTLQMRDMAECNVFSLYHVVCMCSATYHPSI